MKQKTQQDKGIKMGRKNPHMKNMALVLCWLTALGLEPSLECGLYSQ